MIGNATPSDTIARTRILISTVPNFQFVLSIARRYGGSWGSNENISFDMMSVSNTYSAIKRWIRLKEESTLASVSKLADNFSKHTVWTLHKAHINKPKNFIRAKFNLFPKFFDKIKFKLLFLLLNLVFIFIIR
ncbi:MAG: hypothetical protein A2033_16730 [Bacteroidetes bacterium GWA2_31_9]|nr:MAG: hypothetical protein A2033_16730 [Bacteroidetes bacterium GWA2_31_9]